MDRQILGNAMLCGIDPCDVIGPLCGTKGEIIDSGKEGVIACLINFSCAVVSQWLSVTSTVSVIASVTGNDLGQFSLLKTVKIIGHILFPVYR